MKNIINLWVIGVIVATQTFSGNVQAQNIRTDGAVLVAAGSLKTAMDEIVQAYRAQGGAVFNTKYGPSGKLRQEIEAGAVVDVFASAAVEHTEALARQGLLEASQIFTHNDLCVIGRPQLGLREDSVLEVLGRTSVRVATSTPVSDPMGDYTWQFFRKVDKVRPGFFALLDAKALKLSGASVSTPGEKLPYITAFENDRADAYVMYCTNAVITKKALPELDVVRIPDAWNVRSAYGIAAGLQSASGRNFVRFVMTPVAQQILKKHGFD
jgi:molybdate transport system substrate-binding protein